MSEGRKRIGILLLAAACILAAAGGISRKTKTIETFPASGRETAEILPLEILGEDHVLNSGDAEELTELKGIGETLSALIRTEREENGPFQYPEDVTAVKGIGLKKLSQMLGTDGE